MQFALFYESVFALEFDTKPLILNQKVWATNENKLGLSINSIICDYNLSLIS